MTVSIINIGDELLIGQVVNSNAAAMSAMLTTAGMTVAETVVVGDDRNSISGSLNLCISSSDAVLITGGLGPTKDDITKSVLCDYFDSKLIEDQMVVDNIQRIFEARGYELTPTNRQQALVPECCTVINNTVGTAPCMWFDADGGKVVVSMPGVPYEMEHLMRNEIVPRLTRHFSHGSILTKNIITQGIGESFLSDLIEPWENALPPFMRLAYLPQAGMVKLRLTARGNDRKKLAEAVENEVARLKDIAGQFIVGEDVETVTEALAKLFVATGKTLATAESCTGGNIASQITSLAGASAYFRGGVVAYSNDVKENVVGVMHSTIEAHGAVSEQTVREMADGIRRRLEADYGVATSGIAGPSGGTAEKPVGTVWMAVASPTGITTRMKKFGDDRLRTIERATNEVLSMLIHQLTTDSRK